MNTDPQKVNHLAFIETPHIDYPPERRNDSWQNCIKSENSCNEPYWSKLADHFTAAERENQQQTISAAQLALASAMKSNRAKFSGWQVDAFLAKNEMVPDSSTPPVILWQELSKRHGKPVAEILAAIANVEKAFEACQALRIPFQAVVVDELPVESKRLKVAQEAVDKFRQMDLGVTKVSGVAGVASHFKKNSAQAGDRVVLIDGPWKCTRANEGIRTAGVAAKLAGKHGNRLATFVRFNNVRRHKPNEKTRRVQRLLLGKAPATWRESVQRELAINKPYWRRYNATLTQQELIAQEKNHAAAYLELADVMRANKGKFREDQIKAYELDKDSNPLITKAIAACATLRIPFQSVVNTNISWGMSPEVVAFHRMKMGLNKYSTRHKLAEYFKKQKPGTQAVYTGGAKDRATAVNDARQNEIVITLEGTYGNRVATYIGPDGKRKQKKVAWNKSGRLLSDDTNGFAKNKDRLIVGGPAVYIEGAHSTLIRDIAKCFGPASCSVLKTADKKGWMIKLKKITKKSG